MAFHVPERMRVTIGLMASSAAYGNNGAFMVSRLRQPPVLACIASDGEGWEHVSVSLPSRCPTWGEMALVKDLFWDPEDAVMQLHPPASQYVNCHPFCLHLWRPPEGRQIPLPPPWMVGPR
jgi:hypothetical protein